MGKDKKGQTASECNSCGTSRTCGVCGGKGHWETRPDIKCSHCNGSGSCPINN